MSHKIAFKSTLACVPALAGILMMIFTTSCSRSTSSKLQDSSVFNPPPKLGQESSIETQLSRYEGQTSFLNPVNSYYYGDFPSYQNGERSKSGVPSGQRAIQESDIFKIGKEGSKTLFLLNNYRGLQIVSYENGPQAPKILGRVAATGNWPENMYYFPSTDMILVLERVWYDESGNYSSYQDRKSRIVVYNVSDLQKPLIQEVLEFSGEMADSRMVGDVLYVATSVYPEGYWNGQSSSTEQSKGRVFSFRIKAAGVEKIAEQDLVLAVSGRENMNIVEIKDGDSYKYYLVAILAKSRWDWWDRVSAVEVIDISDPNGMIAPVMVANAKGQIRERSLTHIKNSTLIVTSNYWPENDTNKKMRIAVETFRFPTQNSEILDTKEAEYRRLWIDREFERSKKKLSLEFSGDALDDALETARTNLAKDAENAIAGRFEALENGRIRKMLADTVITVGDTQGLNASLQDVRYSDDKLYVFWVPQNYIDPLDVFDISAPEKDVPYLGRTQFEGWVQRSIPFTYMGREFILGLGWVIPSVNNESEKRFPQALLFEVMSTSSTAGTKVKVEPISQMSLKDSHMWTNFNDRDKFVETRFSDHGQGTILFQVYTTKDNRYVSGGKLIGFDLSKALEGKYDSIFAEGGLVLGHQGWLRRVFNNPEIDKVNSFSDKALGTFDIAGTIGSPNDTVKAINILELARNITAYITLPTTPVRGLQLISEDDWYSYEASPKLTLRLVSINRADEERPSALSEVTLDGNYAAHILTSDGRLVLMTHTTKTVTSSDENLRYTVFDVFGVYVLRVTGERADTLEVISKTSWEQEHRYSYEPNFSESKVGGSFWGGYNNHTSMSLTEIEVDRILVLSGFSISMLNLQSTGLVKEDVKVTGCPLENKQTITLRLFDNDLYLTFKEMIDDPTRKNLKYERNFLTPVALNTATAEASCKTSINIPGEIVAILSGGSSVVTNDTRLVDIVEQHWGDKEENIFYRAISETSLAALKVSNNVASLKDQYDLRDVSPNSMKKIGSSSFIFFENEERASDYWRHSFSRSGSQLHNLVTLSVDQNASFLKITHTISLTSSDRANLIDVIAKQDGSFLGIVATGRKIQVIHWTSQASEPKAIKLIPVSERFEKLDAVDAVTLPDPYSLYGYWGNEPTAKVNFTPPQNSIEISQNLYGVLQFFLAE